MKMSYFGNKQNFIEYMSNSWFHLSLYPDLRSELVFF